MRLTRRLADALRSPARFLGLLRRAGELAAGGQLASTLRRLRPRSFTADEYRAWRAAQAAPGEAEGTLGFAIRGDLMGATSATREDADWVLWAARPARLAPGALASLARACAVPGARIVYGDHEAGGMPVFKPVWDTWQVLETPYAGPVVAVHRSLLAGRDAGGAAALWRLLIEATASLPEAAVVHVPAILTSTREQEPLPPRADVAAAVLAAARVRGLTLTAEPGATPWIRYGDASASVSIVVPTRDRPELLERCLAAVRTTQGRREVEVVVVDNGSVDAAVPAVIERARAALAVKVVRDDAPFNYARLCNAGVREAGGHVVILLNNDAVAQPGWLDELASLAVQPGVGTVGPLIVYPDGRLQSAGVLVGVNRSATGALTGMAADDRAARAWCANRRRVSAVLGACVAVARSTYVAAGGLDERFAVSHNEVDFGLRLEALGLANLFTPYARVVHDEGATRGFEVTPGERDRLAAEEALFRERWASRVARCDPAYHPALARTGNPFMLGVPELDATPRAGWDAASR